MSLQETMSANTIITEPHAVTADGKFTILSQNAQEGQPTQELTKGPC